jgi:3-dehydroquinate dehydratase II
MPKILLVQGANLTFLGRREPAIYGTTTPAELDQMLQRHAKNRGYELEIFYTNLEGEAINRIYRAVDEGFDGLVMNPAGFTYAGYALKDCIKGAALPYVEVHISNIAKRNIHCVLSDAAEGMITGFGMHSYILGLDAMLEILRARKNSAVSRTSERSE